MEFGISGNGLAKICDRLNVPYPPRGYWAKKEAGKPVVTFKLTPRSAGTRECVDISPTQPKDETPPEVVAAIAMNSVAIGSVTVPDTLEGLHPKVKAWIAQHQSEQKERAKEVRKRENRLWGFTRPLLDDLTDRDLYRFRVTSALFRAVEKGGGRVDEAQITGKVKFLVNGHQVECSIVEKMFKPVRRPEGAEAKWTAYPEHHQSGLQFTGFLRVTINSYLGGKQPQWIETEKNTIADWLSEIAGTIISAGAILVQREREREESHRRNREEEERRRERERQREIDERRWNRFRERAANWEERIRLTSLVSELKRRLEAEGDSQVADRNISEWIDCAQLKIDATDPFREGLRGFFESVTR